MRLLLSCQWRSFAANDADDDVVAVDSSKLDRCVFDQQGDSVELLHNDTNWSMSLFDVRKPIAD